jgi:hypothetical protein
MVAGVHLVDLDAARAFMAAHARVLDRHRLLSILGEADGASALAAVDAYRNPGGGYGWGLEPDLRSVTSQPVGAMHAMEVFAEAAPLTTVRAVELCDWLHGQTLADGGLPFALPVGDPLGSSPIWTSADPASSSLQMTSQVAAHAHRLAPHQPDIDQHPWLEAATRYCLDAIRRMDDAPHAYALMFSLRFLDAAAPRVPEADAALDQLARHVPADGAVLVEGGAAGEKLHPLDLSPRPGSPSRRLFDEQVIEADLARLARLQQADGGWTVEFETSSPAAELEWRGYATVAAVAILTAHGAIVTL